VAPVSLYGHTTTRIGNRFYLIGGYIDDTLDDSLTKNKIALFTVMNDDTVISNLPKIKTKSDFLFFSFLFLMAGSLVNDALPRTSTVDST
jgi:hypothetical protein